MAHRKLDSDDGFFKTDTKGREVFQWRVSRQFGVQVGDTCEFEGRTFTVEAKGTEFTIGKNNAKWAYLYLEAPVAAAPAATVADKADDFDTDMQATDRQIANSESRREVG